MRVLLAHFVASVGPRGHRGGKGSGEVILIHNFVQAPGSAQSRSQGLFPGATGGKTSKLPMGPNRRRSPHTPEGNRLWVGPPPSERGRPDLFVQACGNDFRPYPRWPPTAARGGRASGCGTEGHWEEAEPPLHKDWKMRVQLAFCRICVAVPALFGRGSPLKEPSNSSLILRSSRP